MRLGEVIKRTGFKSFLEEKIAGLSGVSQCQE